MEYRYPHFKRELLLADMSFQRWPGPGDEMPDFEMPTVEGGRVRKGDFAGKRPLLLTFGSFT